jgi:hypothetical protein
MNPILLDTHNKNWNKYGYVACGFYGIPVRFLDEENPSRLSAGGDHRLSKITRCNIIPSQIRYWLEEYE